MKLLSASKRAIPRTVATCFVFLPAFFFFRQAGAIITALLLAAIAGCFDESAIVSCMIPPATSEAGVSLRVTVASAIVFLGVNVSLFRAASDSFRALEVFSVRSSHWACSIAWPARFHHRHRQGGVVLRSRCATRTRDGPVLRRQGNCRICIWRLSSSATYSATDSPERWLRWLNVYISRQ